MKKTEPVSNALLFFCSILLLTACNQSFDPLQENDRYHFSIYGYLDASVDTQWVRVGTAREALDDIPDPTGISVTLENIGTGEMTEMTDSLFSPENFLNYWTTMDIENEQTYRIKVEGANGNSSHADVTTPTQLPTPLVLENTYRPYGYTIYIDDGVENVADIQSKWYVILNPETDPIKKIYTFAYRNEMEYVEAYNGRYTIFAPENDEEGYIEMNIGNTDYDVIHRQFFVAAAGPEWDESLSTINDLEYFINSTASNVENGLGYVIGIDSKWVPYRSCTNENKSNLAPCPEEKPFW